MIILVLENFLLKSDSRHDIFQLFITCDRISETFKEIEIATCLLTSMVKIQNVYLLQSPVQTHLVKSTVNMGENFQLMSQGF